MMWESATVLMMAWKPAWSKEMGGGRIENRKIFPTFNPLFHTLTRLCVDPIYHRCNVSVTLLFNWRCKNNSDYYAVNNDDKLGGGVSP